MRNSFRSDNCSNFSTEVDYNPKTIKEQISKFKRSQMLTQFFDCRKERIRLKIAIGEVILPQELPFQEEMPACLEDMSLAITVLEAEILALEERLEQQLQEQAQQEFTFANSPKLIQLNPHPHLQSEQKPQQLDQEIDNPGGHLEDSDCFSCFR